ncbi:hypothetical protein BDA99DRAFT_537228 [Phascolomyces articulosus]|uniref:Uncharacterized protein n=1 Tax=Phascolomyces articulosus TaxID=60185 RepID=A0AAD5PE80_9FUNG|nr:hypothetical protein BDA99DRAFT_537228 [Phascolomyces articulosus]
MYKYKIVRSRIMKQKEKKITKKTKIRNKNNKTLYFIHTKRSSKTTNMDEHIHFKTKMIRQKIIYPLFGPNTERTNNTHVKTKTTTKTNASGIFYTNTQTKCFNHNIWKNVHHIQNKKKKSYTYINHLMAITYYIYNAANLMATTQDINDIAYHTYILEIGRNEIKNKKRKGKI